MSELMKVKVSSSPHIRAEDSTRQIMLDVIIALLPAFAVGVFVFGGRAAVLTIVCVLTAVISEYVYQKLMHKRITAFDGSAAVTGMLLALTLPVGVPVWMGIVGSIFAIVVVKQLYGGIGKNFMNPALAGRAFLFSWSAMMTRFSPIRTAMPLFTSPVDVVTCATPLEQMTAGAMPDASLFDMFLGMIPGCIGETSALALIAGGIYLLYRRVISWHIPVSFMGSIALIAILFPRFDGGMNYVLTELMTGGVMMSAFFMATDYTTSPINRKGQLVFGMGCGIITMLIRYFGSYPEGNTYAILLMNAMVYSIEKLTASRVFGHKVKPFEMGGNK